MDSTTLLLAPAVDCDACFGSHIRADSRLCRHENPPHPDQPSFKRHVEPPAQPYHKQGPFHDAGEVFSLHPQKFYSFDIQTRREKCLERNKTKKC